MLLAIMVMSGVAILLAATLSMTRWPGQSAQPQATSGEPHDIPREETALIERINHLLPQTQCRRCTYSGCKPYATALARGEADIDQCPPGGDATALRLARLLGRLPKPVDRRFGVVRDTPLVAWIDESACIGCVKCIQACPVDAIVGAAKFMHTVISNDCTGCELCVAPCPVDCITMRPPIQLHQSVISGPVSRQMTHSS